MLSIGYQLLIICFAVSNSLIGSVFQHNILETFFLSIVQGLTEWFPISSSGHLVFFQELLNVKVSVAFDIMLHTGSLAGVVFFIRNDLYALLKTLFKLNFSSNEGMMLKYLMLGTIPIVMLSLLLKGFLEIIFTSLLSTGVAMLISGIILYLTKYSKPKSKLNTSKALLIGFAQAFAILPGISRMGITVSTALISGLEYDEAYRFSLLLSVLSITGGCIFKLSDISFEREFSDIILGVIITATVSVLVLRFLKKHVIGKSFYRFAYYCLTTGIVILLLGVLKSL